MTDYKVRRVRLFNLEQFCEGHRVGIEEMVMDDTNGDFHLAPVDEYEVVKKETWERVQELASNALQLWCNDFEDFSLGSFAEYVRDNEGWIRALAELAEDNKIGTMPEASETTDERCGDE